MEGERSRFPPDTGPQDEGEAASDGFHPPHQVPLALCGPIVQWSYPMGKRRQNIHPLASPRLLLLY